MQQSGDIMWFPTGWRHATCALDPWTVGIGAQRLPFLNKKMPMLDESKRQTQNQVNAIKHDCLGDIKDENWKWFDGDLNQYYNDLEKDHKRNPTDAAQYAVHRWMGAGRSTLEHYKLLHGAVFRYHANPSLSLQVLDAGCGLGSALMWMENAQPNWKLLGHTISQGQLDFISHKLPKHKFKVNLRSYDKLDEKFDFIYSIEALIHTPNLTATLKMWANHLKDGGIIAIIDDFVQVGVDKEDEGILNFAKSWLANTLMTTAEVGEIGQKLGLSVVEDRDLGTEYRINQLNYRNKKAEIKVDKNKSHQGWAGSKFRQNLMLQGKITYHLVVLQKTRARGRRLSHKSPTPTAMELSEPMTLKHHECTSVQSKAADDVGVSFNKVTEELMSGNGKEGGKKMGCLSGWYCCDKGNEWYDNLEAHRTKKTGFLQLSKDLFGDYMSSFAKHLNTFYATYPTNATGRFLDIGGTGSTASGMKQVLSKFQHFAGPLEYWILDSDPKAKGLDRTLHCDIGDCPSASDCEFDVTFSHTVLEHARRPWQAFDTIARMIKRGG